MRLTHEQRAASETPGNVLVMAGAGTGKTTTLVGRCLRYLLDLELRVSLDRLLLVTFTEAAAAEMRHRLRVALEQAASARAEDPWVAEQLALLDTARISTLHSFCLQLVRDHFHELGLDPQGEVLTPQEASLLEAETLDALLDQHCAADTPESQAVQQLVLDHGRGWDGPIRRLVLRLHHYTQTLKDPRGWFERQLAAFQQERPPHWDAWLLEGFEEWRRLWRATLAELAGENAKAQACAQVLKDVPENPTRARIDEALVALLREDESWPPKMKTRLRKPLEALFADAAFLLSLARVSREERAAAGTGEANDPLTPALSPGERVSGIQSRTKPEPQDEASAACCAPSPGGEGRGAGERGEPAPADTSHPASVDPLVEDWQWVRAPMAALLQLAREFGTAFARTKRDQGALDFHDLEQFALDLLRGRTRDQLTEVARQWRARLDLVFVDEYQDINEAQDAILAALARDGAAANRFLVGDIKQSIYRFRLADPRIFRAYARQWQDGRGGQVRPLAENWRSAEGVLDFVNALFGALLHPEVGGVDYPESARLKFGNHPDRAALRVQPSELPRVELHLRLTGPEPAEPQEWSDAEEEAWLVASRLRALKDEGFPVWDRVRQVVRPVTFADMAVLLRAPRNKAEGYAKVFAQAGVPLVVARSGFFEAPEVRDLLALLEVLDNPLQDLPLLAVLRSPLAGLTLDELALVRLARRDGLCWTALVHFHREPELSDAGVVPSAGSSSDPAPTSSLRLSAHAKVVRFLGQFARWRDLARRGSLSECLETVLDDTSYEAWLAAEPRGTQRGGNVQRLLALTRQFDRFQRQGLFRFLRFVEAQREAELDLEPAAPPTEDAVQLRSIHQSKGLEYPVVVVADLGKRFNLDELKGQVILDDTYGLCPQVKPPHTGQRYPSLPYWLARRRQRQESLGEELRLLYVACTRARDRLILVGSASRQTVEAWPAGRTVPFQPHQVLAANSYLAWLGPWLAASTRHADWTTSGQTSLLAWTVHVADHADPTPPAPAPPAVDGSPAVSAVPADVLPALRARLAWRYPFAAATTEKAKVSVTELRRRAAEEIDEEAVPLFPFRVPRSGFGAGATREGQDAPTPARVEQGSNLLTPPADRPSPAGGEGRGKAVRSAQETGVLSAAAVGTAHHRFLQSLDLARTGSLDHLRAEAARLCAAGVLSTEETQTLDLQALVAFWTSDLGRRICGQAAQVRRELPFTARFAPTELEAAGLPATDGLAAEDFLVVQGVIDLAVFAPQSLWLVDFKTDDVTERDLPGKVAAYGPQLRLYGLALERIYGRTVSARWLHFLKLGRSVAVHIPARGQNRAAVL